MTDRVVQGVQKNWSEIRTKTDKPIITIITSTFNAAKDLPWTIESIKTQTYPYIQWIVVDGASTDDTVELLKENSKVIDVWFSEADTGIYDAWNKALGYVEGDWVLFLGAGDEIFDVESLNGIAQYLKQLPNETDLVYGKVEHISQYQRKRLYISGEKWSYYVGRWESNRPDLPVQTAIFHNVRIFNKFIFDIRYSIVADTSLLLKVLDKDYHMTFYNEIITRMPIGGVSSKPINGTKMYREITLMSKDLGIDIPIQIRVKNFTRFLLVACLTKMLSEQQLNELTDFIRSLRGKPRVHTVE